VYGSSAAVSLAHVHFSHTSVRTTDREACGGGVATMDGSLSVDAHSSIARALAHSHWADALGGGVCVHGIETRDGVPSGGELVRQAALSVHHSRAHSEWATSHGDDEYLFEGVGTAAAHVSPPVPPSPPYRGWTAAAGSVGRSRARAVLHEINARWLSARPTNNLSAAGVLLHAFDGLEHPSLPWTVCPDGEPWLRYCAKFNNRLSASLVRRAHGAAWSGSGHGGFVVRPRVCSVPSDRTAARSATGVTRAAAPRTCTTCRRPCSASICVSSARAGAPNPVRASSVRTLPTPLWT
jgi:hypothetical protein